MVEQVSLAHIPPELAVYVALYTELENAAFLRDQLLAGNTDFEYAFIDASMVCLAPSSKSAPLRMVGRLAKSSACCYLSCFERLPS